MEASPQFGNYAKANSNVSRNRPNPDGKIGRVLGKDYSKSRTARLQTTDRPVPSNLDKQVKK